MNDYTSGIVARQQMADRLREVEKRELAKVARQHRSTVAQRASLATRVSVAARVRLGRLALAILD